MGVVGKKVIEKWIAMLLSLLCFLPAISQNAQTKIEGTIVDQQNQPLPFVSVLIEDTQKGAAAWLEKGAHIYVCGSIAMGQGVKNCLNQLLKGTGFNSVENLQKKSRYHADIY